MNMKLKKFLHILKEAKGENIPFKDLENYLWDKYGSEVTRVGMSAAEMQQICLDLDIETSDEFMDFFPFPNEKLKGYTRDFFSGSDDKEEMYYGEDEESYWDYKDDKDDDKEEFVYDEDYLNDMATMVHNVLEKSEIPNFFVSNSKDNISVQFILSIKERFGKIMKILSLIKKIKTEVLIQYDSEMDLWETKRGQPLLTFDFYYNPDVKGKFEKDDVPF